MSSLYWDDFERRIEETLYSLKTGSLIPVRRVAVFITNRCNFRCAYCNLKPGKKEMPYETFKNILDRYGKDAIIHITGGEPSCVGWLYPFMERHPQFRFHLNTNAFILPSTKAKRIKVSLDTSTSSYFDRLVGGCVGLSNALQRILK